MAKKPDANAKPAATSRMTAAEFGSAIGRCAGLVNEWNRLGRAPGIPKFKAQLEKRLYGALPRNIPTFDPADVPKVKAALREKNTVGYLLAEFAEKIGVNEVTVRRWLDHGKAPGVPDFSADLEEIRKGRCHREAQTIKRKHVRAVMAALKRRSRKEGKPVPESPLPDGRIAQHDVLATYRWATKKRLEVWRNKVTPLLGRKLDVQWLPFKAGETPKLVACYLSEELETVGKTIRAACGVWTDEGGNEHLTIARLAARHDLNEQLVREIVRENKATLVPRRRKVWDIAKASRGPDGQGGPDANAKPRKIERAERRLRTVIEATKFATLVAARGEQRESIDTENGKCIRLAEIERRWLDSNTFVERWKRGKEFLGEEPYSEQARILIKTNSGTLQSTTVRFYLETHAEIIAKAPTAPEEFIFFDAHGAWRSAANFAAAVGCNARKIQYVFSVPPQGKPRRRTSGVPRAEGSEIPIIREWRAALEREPNTKLVPRQTGVGSAKIRVCHEADAIVLARLLGHDLAPIPLSDRKGDELQLVPKTRLQKRKANFAMLYATWISFARDLVAGGEPAEPAKVRDRWNELTPTEQMQRAGFSGQYPGASGCEAVRKVLRRAGFDPVPADRDKSSRLRDAWIAYAKDLRAEGREVLPAIVRDWWNGLSPDEQVRRAGFIKSYPGKSGREYIRQVLRSAGF